MSGVANFNMDGAMDHCRKRAVQFITIAAIEITRRAKELLSVPGTAFATGHGRKKKGERITGAVRSAPGEPPRKQTGGLRGSATATTPEDPDEHTTYEVDESAMAARVGTNLLYGKALELGTKRGLKPRPWLRRAAFEMKGRVNELLSKMKEAA